MDSYYHNSNNHRAVSNKSAEKRLSEILYLTHTLHPENASDFASSFMNPAALNDQREHIPSNLAAQNDSSFLAPLANPPPWEDPDHSWRYIGDYVWTGEALVLAPRPRQRYRADSDMMLDNARHTIAPSLAFPDILPNTLPSDSNRTSTSSIGDAARPQELSVAPICNMNKSPLVQEAPPIQEASATAQVVTEWSDEDILLLYKWKMIKKKGNAVILSHFPGHTEESIASAWKKYRAYGQRLYDETKGDRRSSSYEA